MNAKDDKHLRALALQAVRHLQSEGFKTFWAGGCLRDILLGHQPNDYDIATTATPEQVVSLFPNSTPVGKAFGVVKAVLGHASFEIATFRRDDEYLDGRRPTGVAFTDPETDAKRRDFTVNAIFLDPLSGVYHDYVGGRADLKSRLIRFVGDPRERIREDHLRVLRAVRLAAILEFSVDPASARAIREHAGLIRKVSAERIHDELTRALLEARRAGDAVVLLDELELLEVILPEIKAMQGQAQPAQFHPEGDVFEHTIQMLNLMDTASSQLAYSVFLHDVGKPVTAHSTPQRIRFDAHAPRGAEIARDILCRLRFSSADRDVITHCIRNHMRFMDIPNMRRATLRRLVGAPTFPIELELHRLDCLASHGNLDNVKLLERFQEELASEPSLPAPWLSGHDIMKIGIPEGPEVGEWGRKAYDAQLEDRFETREDLRAWLEGQIRDEARGAGKKRTTRVDAPDETA